MSRKDLEAAYAVRVLRSFGCDVQRLCERPEEQTQTADLSATVDGARYVVECKTKNSDAGRVARIHRNLLRGRVASDSESSYRNNGISKHLRKAESQLSATAVDDATFRLAWMRITGVDYTLRWRQAFAAFYGAVDVWCLTSDAWWQCLYFDSAASKRLAGVDGLFLVDKRGLTLCLNEFSSRIGKLRESPLVLRLRNGVFDPREQINSSSEYVELMKQPRRMSEQDREAALSQQLGEQVVTVRLDQYSAYVAVPRGRA